MSSSSSTQFVERPYTAACGLYPFKYESLKKELKELPTLNNSTVTLGNIISWIPFIGAIIGAMYIYAGYKMYFDKNADDWDREIAKSLIGRGIATILCIGPLLMIVDIVVTIARQCIEK